MYIVILKVNNTSNIKISKSYNKSSENILYYAYSRLNLYDKVIESIYREIDPVSLNSTIFKLKDLDRITNIIDKTIDLLDNDAKEIEPPTLVIKEREIEIDEVTEVAEVTEVKGVKELDEFHEVSVIYDNSPGRDISSLLYIDNDVDLQFVVYISGMIPTESININEFDISSIFILKGLGVYNLFREEIRVDVMIYFYIIYMCKHWNISQLELSVIMNSVRSSIIDLNITGVENVRILMISLYNMCTMANLDAITEDFNSEVSDHSNYLKSLKCNDYFDLCKLNSVEAINYCELWYNYRITSNFKQCKVFVKYLHKYSN